MSLQLGSTELRESVGRQAKTAGFGQSTLSQLTEKWNKEIQIIHEAFKGKISEDKKVGTAIMLENTERFLRGADAAKQMFALTEATQPSDVSFFKQFAFNNLLAVYPNLIAPELVSTQPMLSRAGEIRYMRVLYGSNKGAFKKGDTMFQQFNLGDHPNNPEYSSDEVTAEVIGSDGTLTQFNLEWTPTEPGSVIFSDDMGVTIARDDSTGNIVNPAGSTIGTINYGTGAVTFTNAPATGVEAAYRYDNISAPVQAPEVQVKIVASPIYARSRKLKTLYAFDGAADLVNDYGITLSSEILSMSSAQLKREIDDEIILDLANKGTAPGTEFDATIPSGVSLVDHYAGFPAAVTVASNNIWDLTQVANGSWLVLGISAANIVESIPRFKSSGVINPKGAHLAGYLGNLPVFKSNALKADDWLMGYRGDSLFEAGYVYAPYLPIMATQLLMDETFTGRQGFSTSYGKKMTNSDFYGKSAITRS